MPLPHASIEVRSECPGIRISLAQVRRRARAMLRKAGFKRQGLSILLVGDRRMRVLNRRFLNHDRTTDVISFNLGGAGKIAGEVIISLETARTKAKELKHSFLYEFYFYLCHGILHLAGYEDSTQRRRQAMFRKQEKILKQLKISRVSS